jgi:hypothetical protein
MLFAIREQRTCAGGMPLIPHDLVVALKRVVAGPLTYDQLTTSLDLSKSEAHAAVKRAKTAGLRRADRQPVHHAILEFVLHGVRYAFPAVLGRQAQGMPTAHAAPPLSELIHAGLDPIPVWPDAQGEARGESFQPLYPSAPAASRADPKLYQCLCLIDALRGGRVRERNLAEEHLARLING